jgi:hypothetical protein
MAGLRNSEVGQGGQVADKRPTLRTAEWTGERIDMDESMSVRAWRTGDAGIRLLVANLEEGLRDVSDASCHATTLLPAT